MTYIFKYKKGWFWRSAKVVGHRLDQSNNRMDLFFENGSIKSIGQWDKYDLFLGTDWVLFTKNQMEDESGQDIKLKRAITKGNI